MRVSHIAMLANQSTAGAVPSSLPALNDANNVIDPEDAFASIDIVSNGSILEGFLDQSHDWFLPNSAGIGSTHWVKFVISSGTVDAGVVSGTWYQLTGSKTISKTRTVPGSASASGTYFISTGGSDGTIVGDADGGTWSLSVTIEV